MDCTEHTWDVMASTIVLRSLKSGERKYCWFSSCGEEEMALISASLAFSVIPTTNT